MALAIPNVLPTAARFHLDGYAVVHKALKDKA